MSWRLRGEETAKRNRKKQQKEPFVEGRVLEEHRGPLGVTACSVSKASLPSEAQATNCTSEGGQDGIHRAATATDLSPPSAASQARHRRRRLFADSGDGQEG